ncbi:MAG: biotin--[acetyl-CoA-carboxylase] ligase [Gammaproteobacteria bacterium]|nr:biotin--[acetyl-CoA-carboxylase] ligase [Gammaproteobacteria bacterium]
MSDAFELLRLQRRANIGRLSADDRAALQQAAISLVGESAQVADDVEFLDATTIQSALAPVTQDWLTALEVVTTIPSTNAELARRAEAQSVNGAVLTAEVQTAGRGRRGREWLSPFGRNLAVSLGVAIDRPPAQVGALGLAVGLGVHDALADMGARGVQLKWPNDVLLDGRKVAGILVELVRLSPVVEVVIGIGINVGCASAIASQVEQPIADVAEAVPEVSRNQLLARVLDHVLAESHAFAASSFPAMHARWRNAHRHEGETVTVTTPTERVSGVASVLPSGALALDTVGGRREFTGGEVSVRPPGGQVAP